MCGRFALFHIARFADLFPWIRMIDDADQIPPRFNIAPSQAVLAVCNLPGFPVRSLGWGLVPSWAKDVSIGNKLINARGETVAEKPSFRAALARRRCIIPADGFYEWKLDADGKTKTPMFIRHVDDRPFGIAGLWERWTSPDGGELESCCIITTAPNELMSQIHDRMPVIVPEERWRDWLRPEPLKPIDTLPFVRSFPATSMTALAVSRRVNAPRNDGPDLIEPASETLFE
jgi:putative SOS response-associated peptidase YedK